MAIIRATVTPARRRAAILAFVALYFGGQLVVVAWSYVRGDRLGGYQMFAETTFFTARLFRVTKDGRREPVHGGTWRARDASGRLREYRWQRYVNDFRLDLLDRRTRAKIGIDVTLKFFQLSLDHVARAVPDDRETVRFEIDIAYETASGKTSQRSLASADRPEAAVAP